jgi:hypothetical protein
MAKIQQHIAGRTGAGASGVNIPSSGFRQINTDTGIGRLGQTLSNIGSDIKKRFEDAEKVSQMSSLKVQTIKRFAELEKEYKNRTDYQNFGDRADKLSKFRKELEDQITYQDVKDSFMPYFENSAVRFDVGIDSLARDKFIDTDKAAVINEMNNLVQVSSGMGKEKIMSEILPLVTSGVAGREGSGVLDPVNSDLLVNKTAARIWDLYIENAIDGNSATINADLENDDNFPGLTPERREYWQDIGRAKEESLRKEASENKVRDVYDAVSIKYDDPDEAIAFLLKPGTAKDLGMSSDEMNKVVKIVKDKRSELKLAAENKKDMIELEKETKQKQKEDIIKNAKNEIANDLFKFEKANDLEGMLAYIDNIPNEFGDLKRKELNTYYKGLKEAQAKDTAANAKKRQLEKDIAAENKKNAGDKHKEDLNRINADIYSFESTGDLVGYKNYVDSLDKKKYGKLKREELKNIKKLKKEADERQKGIVFSTAENELARRIRFDTSNVNKSDIRDIGETTGSTEKLLKMYENATKKGTVQTGLERRIKNATEAIIERRKKEEGLNLFSFLPGGKPLYGSFTDEDMADIENKLAVFNDKIDDHFEQFPDTTEAQAQELYNQYVRPEIAKKVTEVISRPLVQQKEIELPKLTTQEEVDNLKDGSRFIWSDGKTYTKGGK